MQSVRFLKEKHKGKITKDFQRDLKRLKAGEPLDYVIGFVSFLGCKIDLSQKPLIPRPETEFWAEKALKEVKGRCLDMFSGSGCIGLAVLKNTKASVDFADNDKKCLKQIRINLKQNNLKGRIICSDVFSNIAGKYDYIFANPPYISYKRKSKVQKSVLKYEPHNALFSKDNGMEIIKRFLAELPYHLKENGVAYMEFDPVQKREIAKLIKGTFEKDQYGKFRYVVLRKNYCTIK
ncbi:peptide chain release factor N(5)-glutamine methyltransferase [Patescibacteria group bacterium]|nr:peptide chain release factor N(5)-glutamine methyltransferase [Patescibacteria group bacterium]